MAEFHAVAVLGGNCIELWEFKFLDVMKHGLFSTEERHALRKPSSMKILTFRKFALSD